MSSSKSFNVWEYKPWWCQPWSILLTGILIVGSSWLLTQRIWLVLAVSLPILLWWVYFLILYPRLMDDLQLTSQQAIAPTKQE